MSDSRTYALALGAAGALVLALDHVKPTNARKDKPPALDARQRAAVKVLNGYRDVCSAPGTYVALSDPDLGYDAMSPLLAYGVQLSGLAIKYGQRITLGGRRYPTMPLDCARTWGAQWVAAGNGYLAASGGTEGHTGVFGSMLGIFPSGDQGAVATAHRRLKQWLDELEAGDLFLRNTLPASDWERFARETTQDLIRDLAAEMGGVWDLETTAPMPERKSYWSFFNARGKALAFDVGGAVFGATGSALGNAVAGAALSAPVLAGILGYIAWRHYR